MTFKILLPVDGSESSVHAARHVASMSALLKDFHVHLVHVESSGDDWRVRRTLRPEELAEMEQEWGEAVMNPVRAILEAAGIPCTEHMVQGEAPQTIIRLASELGCNQIVMGTRGQSALAGLLMGSVATRVLHLAHIPVTLVK